MKLRVVFPALQRTCNATHSQVKQDQHSVCNIHVLPRSMLGTWIVVGCGCQVFQRPTIARWICDVCGRYMLPRSTLGVWPAGFLAALLPYPIEHPATGHVWAFMGQHSASSAIPESRRSLPQKTDGWPTSTQSKIHWSSIKGQDPG